MTYRTFIKSWGALLLVPFLLTSILIGVSSGAVIDSWLRAEVKVIPVGVFGNHSSITMWGYAKCAAGFTNCTTATVPGPTLTAAAGDTLNIHVFNNISGSYKEPTSVVIPGQTKTMAPVWFNPATGAVTATGSRPAGDVTSRVRSFDAETQFRQTTTYTWPSLRSGTYLYESGTHPAVQVQMGLYGPLIVGAGAGPEATLLFSEIDPVLHAAVSNGDYGPGKTVTSPTGYRSQYFLVNGLPYSASSPAVAAGSPGQTVRLRLLNAGLEPKMPTLQDPHHLLPPTNQYMTVIAEDGNVLPHRRLQYSHLLPPGKTLDATITTQPNAAGGGNIVLYDMKLNLSNGPFSPGGALINLNVGPLPAVMALPSVLNFGAVPLFRPTQMVVAIKNDGLMPLIFTSATITGPSRAEFRPPILGLTTIPPGTSSSLTVLFRPTTEGPKSAALTLISNDPNLGTVTIPIFGNGY